MMHENSLAAYTEEKPKFVSREQNILTFIKAYGPITDRQLCERMGFQEMNQVRPRVTELIKAGLAIETGSTICQVSKKRVRVVSALLV